VTASEAIYALLAASLPAYGAPPVEVVAVENIKPPGAWQNLALPYVIHFPVSEDPMHAHGSLVAGRSWLYQVSVFASSLGSCETVANAVRAILGHVHTSAGVRIHYADSRYLGREDETGVHHWAMTFRVTEALGS
jgi:hypothetical protein